MLTVRSGVVYARTRGEVVVSRGGRKWAVIARRGPGRGRVITICSVRLWMCTRARVVSKDEKHDCPVDVSVEKILWRPISKYLSCRGIGRDVSWRGLQNL